MLTKFTIERNEYLKQSIVGYYRSPYLGFEKTGNPDYITNLKNDYGNSAPNLLSSAKNQLVSNLINEIVYIRDLIDIPIGKSLYVCLVPRSKNFATYNNNQLLFQNIIREEVNKFSPYFYIMDGGDFIIRHTSTKTTHLSRSQNVLNNDGEMPYPGITKKTCTLSKKIAGKHLLLIDDIYTKTVNIDEDAIQALLDAGASSVTFYAIGYTVFRNANRS